MALADTTELAAMVDAARDGCDTAWEAIVRRFDSLVRGAARRHRLGAAQTDDVVQSTWLRLMTNLHRIRDPERLPGWLWTVASRESLRVIADGKRERVVDVTDIDVTDTAPNPAAEVATRDEYARLHEAVEELPDTYRGLMQALLDEDGHSYAEISDRLGLPIGSIGPMRARGCTMLRRHPSVATRAHAA